MGVNDEAVRNFLRRLTDEQLAEVSQRHTGHNLGIAAELERRRAAERERIAESDRRFLRALGIEPL